MEEKSILEQLRELKQEMNKEKFLPLFKKYISNIICNMGWNGDTDKTFATMFSMFNRKYDFKSKNIMTTKIDTKNMVVNAVINPYLVVNLEESDFINFIKHEIIHLLSLHQTRSASISKVIPSTYVSITADLITNYLLEKETSISLNKNFITTSALKEEFDVDIEVTKDSTLELLVHEVYDKLVDNPKFRERMNQNQQQNGGQNQQGGENGEQQGDSCQGEQGQQGGEQGQQSGGGKGEQEEGQEQEQQGGGYKTDENGDVTEADKYSGAEDGLDSTSEEGKKVAEELAKGIAQRGIKTKASRGIGGGVLDGLLEVILAPPVISWKELLKKYMASKLTNLKRNPMRLSRRQPGRLDLRGKKKNKEVGIVVAVDTSGSVGQEALKDFFNEIFAIMGDRDTEITVLEFTSQIDKAYKVKNKNDIDLNINCGGTVFNSVFEWMLEHGNKEDVLIFMTDGYGEEQLQSRRINHQATIFVLSETKGALSLKGENLPRNSKVISMKDNPVKK